MVNEDYKDKYWFWHIVIERRVMPLVYIFDNKQISVKNLSYVNGLPNGDIKILKVINIW